jgi:hypothetical protein
MVKDLENNGLKTGFLGELFSLDFLGMSPETKICTMSQVLVAHAYTSSYSGGRNQD